MNGGGLNKINFQNEWRWVKQSGGLIPPPNGEPGCIAIISGEDITQARTTYDHLRYASTHDALTGLYNWSYFNDSLEQIQKKGLFPAAVVMMDMDNLKTINDTLGHAAGDEYLHDIGSLLKETFRSCDVVARVGGDEFAVLLPWVSEMDAGEIVRRVRERFCTGLTRSGMSLDVLSFGVCAAENAAELIEARRQADRRMYQDKLKRKAKYSSQISDLPMRREELPRMHVRS
jgi:diguanylate cyclase (GGDEF)-like protein